MQKFDTRKLYTKYSPLCIKQKCECVMPLRKLPPAGVNLSADVL